VAHFVNTTEAGAIADVTVRLQYLDSTAPIFPTNYRLISGGFISNRETVLYLTFVPAAVTGTAMVDVTMVQYI